MPKLITLLVVTGALVQIILADPTLTCGENELFSKCGLDGCQKMYCNDLDLPPVCRDGPCWPRCDCKPGYLRASYDDNTCVPVDQCQRKCKDNENYGCPFQRCEPQTCKKRGTDVLCPPLGLNGECPVEPTCICNTGYLRDDSGHCIPDD